MWRENKGFSTIETMSALSLWLFVLLTVVPLWDKLIADEKMAESREIGYQMMNESISKYVMSGEGSCVKNDYKEQSYLCNEVGGGGRISKRMYQSRSL